MTNQFSLWAASSESKCRAAYGQQVVAQYALQQSQR